MGAVICHLPPFFARSVSSAPFFFRAILRDVAFGERKNLRRLIGRRLGSLRCFLFVRIIEAARERGKQDDGD